MLFLPNIEYSENPVYLFFFAKSLHVETQDTKNPHNNAWVYFF